jgi:hypothetical protein
MPKPNFQTNKEYKPQYKWEGFISPIGKHGPKPY